jgi:hypothetical protein
MYLFRQDMVFENVLEHHNGVIGDGTADQCMHVDGRKAKCVLGFKTGFAGC